MSLLNRLEKKYGVYAVPNLVPALVVGQVAVWLLSRVQAGGGPAAWNLRDVVRLRPDLILQGEAWRLVTFLFEPPPYHFVWMLLHWYALFFIGQALERTWGPFRLTLYLLIGYTATVVVAFFLPAGFPVTNAYLFTSLFLAFASLYPDFVFHIYFILPVKARWLAGLTWLFFVLRVCSGGWPAFWLVMATIADYLLFFGGRLFHSAKDAKRRHDFRLKVASADKKLVHECRVCGLTSQMDPKASFRYCSKCEGRCCYCADHIRDHEHVGAARSEKVEE